MAHATDSNRIATAAELESYLEEILSIVKNPATRAKLEAEIRGRMAARGVISLATVTLRNELY